MQHTVMHYSAYDYTCHYLNLYISFIFNIVNFNTFNVIKKIICVVTFENQPEIKNTMKAMIQISHLELILFFFYKMQEVNHFFNLCTTKTPGSAKKIKIIIIKSHFIFIPVLEKLGSADFVNQKNKK